MISVEADLEDDAGLQPQSYLDALVARGARVSRRAAWRENMHPQPDTEMSSGSGGGCPGHGRAGEGMAAPGTAP